ncbi:hypothetical protein L1049_005144 [Liquidambar formosana]|uniref:MAR-binding filament-like protein 1-1 n=1 Tax=Liquidambar formosana TaxID=63359 RepID=A0AAP0RUK1_LIQFO
MGFAMGSSCFLHSPLYQTHLPSFSSSSSQSVFSYYCTRNAETRTRTRNRAPMVSSHHGSSDDGVFCKRRAILFVGISVLPFLQLRARALEGSVIEERALRTPEENQDPEQALQKDSSPNPFLLLLNGVGIFSSGVLGALYALAQKERTASEAVIESIRSKLKEKEATIVSMEKNFELKLLNEQEERTKQLKKAKEEQQCLMDQLKSANSTIKGLGQELQSEKRLVEELRFEVYSLQSDLLKAGEDKKALEENLKEKLDSIEVLQERINLLSLEIRDKEDNVQNLSSSLADKELEFKNLNAIYKQTKDELVEANSEIKELKEELLKNKEELESKISAVNDLNARVSSLIVERDESSKRIDAIQVKYNDLQISSENKAASDAQLLEEREEELHQLEEKLKLSLNEASRNQSIIADLTQERDDLRKMLDIELNTVKNMKHDLQITQKNLGTSRSEASDLAKQLKESKILCTELKAEVSRAGAEFAKASESFQKSLDEAKRNGEVLAGELMTAKELLKKTKDNLQIVSCDLAAAAENRDSLQKELVDVYKKAENASNELKEEKQIVTSLNKELQALEKQILKDKEAHKSLKIDLEEATKALDEMNQNALILSKDLEMANSHISSLEDEKVVLYKSILEQKNVSQEARENMEDAHTLVMRLGKERESLERKAKKLEEELASAKGEILRLRSRINSSRTVVNDRHQEKGEAEVNVGVSVKKNGRRRKSGQQ